MQETKERVFDQSLTQLNKSTIDSREVAVMCDKEHSKLLRDIRNYCVVLNEAKIGLVEFFLESTYKDSKGEERPCYLLTRKGCDMVANKMTGEKGIIFTAKYVTRFEEMEEALRQQQPILTQGLSPQLQLLINMELEQKKIKEQAEHATATAIEAKAEVQAMRDVITLDHKAWRDDIRKIVISIAQKFGGNNYIQDVWKEAYSLLEQRGRTKLDVRLNNRRKNIFAETGSMSKANKYSKLDVIDEEAKLRETFIAIVKEMAIKYGVA